ncbi:hypothetical protein JCM21900_001193 [Sporobolomyces salmonicolor]
MGASISAGANPSNTGILAPRPTSTSRSVPATSTTGASATGAAAGPAGTRSSVAGARTAKAGLRESSFFSLLAVAVALAF